MKKKTITSDSNDSSNSFSSSNKSRPKTLNIEFYENFLRNIGDFALPKEVDPYLKSIFDKVNQEYFNNEILLCNLKWGSFSTRTLGHYSFGTDSITISEIFRDLEADQLKFLESVMYHEMLHKKHKFYSNDANQKRYHTGVFKNEERKFKDFENIDKQMPYFIQSRIRHKRYSSRQSLSISDENDTIHPKEIKKAKSLLGKFFSWD